MTIKKEKKENDVVVFEKDVDMSSASRGVWLVKVPKYISKRWEKCPGNIEAGRLQITKSIFFST
jgi:TFIIF, beta subunit N-terminus